ncbi:serine/threonine protein kinase [bacterium]|nr:serine/threonine protein kinase [bacterium]
MTIPAAQPARVPAPDGTRTNNAPLLVLPQGTLVRGLKMFYLAAGGMSVAYKAQRPNGSWVFVKEVPTSQSQSVMSLTQEKALLERLRHPGIVQVHDLFECREHLYLVQDFIEGGNLEQQISPFPDIYLSEAVVRSWALQLCDIFEYLHSQQPPIIYRDLKPKNVLRDTAGKLYLVDFGIARAYKQGKEQDTRLLGSVLTASPEHYGGQTDQRSDLYTLGATLHYLLTNGQGERVSPFDFPPVRALNREVSAEFERVIQRCLERQPDRRYQSVTELRRALSGHTADPVPIPEPVPAPAMQVEVGATRSWPGLVAGLCLGVGLTLLLTRPKPAVPSATPSPSSTLLAQLPPVSVTPELLYSPRPVVVTTPAPIVAPPPVVAATPPPDPPPPVAVVTPRLSPEPAYPVNTPRLPDPPSIPQPSVRPIEVLTQLGLPWAGMDEMRDLPLGSLRRVESMEGPQGLFRITVPPGFRVLGTPDDFLLIRLDRGNTRLIRFHTVVGAYLDPLQLSEARGRQLAAQVIESRPLTMFGKQVMGLVVQLPRRRGRLEEVIWSQPDPDWTLAVAAASSPPTFSELQANFERLMESWALP